MGQFSNPVATHPCTNEVEVPPPPPGTVALRPGEIAYGHSNSMSQFAGTRNTTAKADNGRIPSTSQSGA